MQNIEKDLSDQRRNYQKYTLLESTVTDNPMDLFQAWYNAAVDSQRIDEANAMTISTVSADGKPNARVVLLKRFTWEGFYFYTNYESQKGRDLKANPYACLSFFWDALERQVTIHCKIEKAPKDFSDGYFASRPRGSRLGALASDQSSVVPSREFLDQRLSDLEKQYEGKDILRPEHCGMYLARAESIEFWQGRPNRMHDRLLFTLTDDFNWIIKRLAP